MKLAITKGATSVSLYIFIQDSSSTTGSGLAGLVYNSASLTAYYVRPLGSATAITLATQTVTGAWSSGGFVEIDATNMKGLYRFDIPDACLATGVNSVVVLLRGATNMAPVALEIELTAFDLQTATQPVNATQFAGQTITAAAGVTIPSSIASPTNITAGTITTTTNLTNAPTSGDFTATMKTSLNAATPASVVGAVGSVTGNVGGNVTGSVGSVAGAVGSVTGNVGGNVVGNVNGNVVGTVASVVGAVGSVTGLTTSTITTAVLAGTIDGSIVLSVALARILAVTVNSCVITGTDPLTLTFRNAADASNVLVQSVPVASPTGRTTT